VTVLDEYKRHRFHHLPFQENIKEAGAQVDQTQTPASTMFGSNYSFNAQPRQGLFYYTALVAYSLYSYSPLHLKRCMSVCQLHMMV
jgi:hypothetical protein